MLQNRGIIISNISNLYVVEDVSTNVIIKCNARGKLKEQKITPTVGDFVEYTVIDEQKNEGVIDSIQERKSFIKRPKISNLTQLILVVSMKMPKPDLLMLDKQLAFSEFNEITPIICLNKIDLEDDAVIDDIEKKYSAIGYKVIKTDCVNNTGIDQIEKLLKGNITAFSGNSGVRKINVNKQNFC